LPLIYSIKITLCSENKMPRANRLQSAARKQLLEASKASGQTKLSFSTQFVVVNDNAECNAEERHSGIDDASGS
jgi:hypothetical protein